ncbi:hypothetical protein GCM10009747_13610 [Agromyces humatus]|uniref:Uncharacterized protein n=1 Tax=Agromyces humatus TaxID=279573 RepID=A0ABP4WSA3_9MICO
MRSARSAASSTKGQASRRPGSTAINSWRASTSGETAVVRGAPVEVAQGERRAEDQPDARDLAPVEALESLLG